MGNLKFVSAKRPGAFSFGRPQHKVIPTAKSQWAFVFSRVFQGPAMSGSLFFEGFEVHLILHWCEGIKPIGLCQLLDRLMRSQTRLLWWKGNREDVQAGEKCYFTSTFHVEIAVAINHRAAMVRTIREGKKKGPRRTLSFPRLTSLRNSSKYRSVQSDGIVIFRTLPFP